MLLVGQEHVGKLGIQDSAVEGSKAQRCKRPCAVGKLLYLPHVELSKLCEFLNNEYV